MESNLKRISKSLVSSLCFQTVLKFLNTVDAVKIQQLSKQVYNVIIPRSIYLCPTFYKQVYAIDQIVTNLIIYEPATGLFKGT